MATSARDVIEGLREEIRRIERRAAPCARLVASGRPDVDAALPGGGFPRGVISELAGAPGSGKTALALTTIAHAMGDQGLAAFVDGFGELYPPAAAAVGVDLDRFLIVRPPASRGNREATRLVWWAAEAVLASGAFVAVALDLPTPDAAVRVDAMLRRLRAAADKGGAAVLWLSAEDAPRVPAAVRLELACGAGGASVRRAFAGDARASAAHAASSGRAPRSPSRAAGGVHAA